MKDSSDLKEKLRSIDRKGYSAYKSLQGSYDLGQYTVHIDYVQSDPFAPPSRMRVRVDQKLAGLPV